MLDDGPYVLLKLGKGVRLLETQQAITALVNSIIRLMYSYVVLCVFSVTMCAYPSVSMPSCCIRWAASCENCFCICENKGTDQRLCFHYIDGSNVIQVHGVHVIRER